MRCSLSTSHPFDHPKHTYMCIYIYGHPPPLRQTLELHFQSVQEGGGRPTLQSSASFQKSKNPKNPTQVSDFWKLEREPQNPKIEQNPRVSKIPKIPTQVSGFWKLEREPQNPKIEQIPRVSKIPNLGVVFLDFWNFGNSRNLLDFWIWRLPLEFPKFQKSKNSNPSLGFLETRTGASKSKNRANSSSFQNSKPWGDFFGFLEFWKLEEFARFLDFEAPVRVSKNPNLWGGFLDFWNFGNWSLYKIFSGVLI